jgi:NAD(P)H-nitrite reductase large subunit
MIGAERHLPYDRPPLTKSLWFGTKNVDDIYFHDKAFYETNGIELRLGTSVVKLDSVNKTVTDDSGATIAFGKLLLTTGGMPKVLQIPGGRTAGVFYYRYLDDYTRLRDQMSPGARAVVIGSGFIGSEIAAALCRNRVEVTMVFPQKHICRRVFPESLGMSITDRYAQEGIRMESGDVPVAIERKNGAFLTTTRKGRRIESDAVIAGLGIAPSLELAHTGALTADGGIAVDRFLTTSHPDIFAAGDNALFRYDILGESLRIEHWDCAKSQGACAGESMAGNRRPYDYLPYFFSDLFDLSYEAVGEVDARLETSVDWQIENEMGVVYYLRNERVRGVMMCNVWEKTGQAREIIRCGKRLTREDLRAAIR